MSANENSETTNTLFVAGGMALMVFGAGLMMAHPFIRRTVLAGLRPLLPELGEPLKASVGKVLPDIERYLKIKGL